MTERDCVCRVLVIIGKGHLEECVKRVGSGTRVGLESIASIDYMKKAENMGEEERALIEEQLRVYL